MLTTSQVEHYRLFGFTVARGALDARAMARVGADFHEAVSDRHFDTPFDGRARRFVPTLGPRTPFLASLLEDGRLCDAADALLEGRSIGIAGDAHRYTGDTIWHPDTNSIHQYGVKAAIYLQPLAADSGALRIIPGSHRAPLHHELRRAFDAQRPAVGDWPGQPLPTEPGDIVFFDLRAWHASAGGSRDRHMCTLIWFHDPRTLEEEEATRAAARVPFHPRRDSFYDERWRCADDASPRRRRWVRRLDELGFFSHMPTD